MSWPAVLCLVLILPSLFVSRAQAQDQTASQPEADQEFFRMERVPVAGGAELLTIQARVNSSTNPKGTPGWIPTVSVLRDTLGDDKQENDRLRYLWALSYTRPTFWQRVSGAVPFLYRQVASRKASNHAPPPLMDLSAPANDVWRRLCWTALQTILLDPYGTPIRASTRSYQRNMADLRKSHMIQAISLLSLYQELGHEQIFSDAELKEIQARLLLTDKTFGGLVDELKLPHFYQKETTAVRDERGQNWEMLRQQAELNNLYFEPLELPDGSATHALLWIAKSELATPSGQRFDGRFLNIANPWNDKRLQNWRGHVATRSFSADQRPAASDTPGASQVELIPLALYGLDHPRIPILLVDFRDRQNAKRREMSRRILEDVTRNVLALSQFGDVPYFLGRSVFDFVTGRRGMDLNQPSRLKTYAQLKLLLSLNASLNPELRNEISDRLEIVSLNPLENDTDSERRMAQEQYAALLKYVARPDGLPAKLGRDRRAELAVQEHNGPARFLFHFAKLLSFGAYTHREKESADLQDRLDVARQLSYHTRFLREVSQSGIHQSRAPQPLEALPRIDLVWNTGQIKHSLHYLAEHGAIAGAKAAAATARIFARTDDDELRHVCLDTLSQINNPKARIELVRIAESKAVDQGWRDLSNHYLSGQRPAEPAVSSGTTTTPGQRNRQ